MTPRTGPDYVQFYPTLRCNMACDFCFNRPLPSLDDMSLDSFRRMLDRLPPTVKAIDIIGGEPTLHAALADMIREAGERGYAVNMSSNGTNPEMLRGIAISCPAANLGVSINDREILSALSSLVRAHRVAVKTVYSDRLDAAFLKEVLSLNPKKFYLIYRDAVEPEHLSETVPFPEFLDAIRRMQPAPGTVYCSGFLPDSAFPELETVRCPAGTTKLGILPDGSVYPCNLLFGRPELLLGNILVQSFADIWHHPSLDFFRFYSANCCPRRGCTLHSRCHGGCPAHGLFHAGNPAAADPRCSRRT